MRLRNLWLLGLTLSSFCLRTVAAEPEATPGEWKLISTSENVSLYRRTRPGPGHYETKAIGEIAAPSQMVQAVIDDVDAYPKFMPYTVESRTLRKEGDALIGYQRISSPMVKDRDYTLRVRKSSKPVEGGIQYLTRWETDNAHGPPEKPGVVRVNLCEGSWLFEPIGPSATRATYSIHTDSGGGIPAFIKNIGGQIAIRKIFAAIRKQVLDPKYKIKPAN